MALQIRRGTDAQRVGITFNEGEIVYVIDTKRVYVGDGSTAGGIEVGVAGGVQEDSVQTTDATQTTLASYAIPTGEERILKVMVRGFEPATNTGFWRFFRFCVKNVGGTASLVGGVASDTGYDAGASAWDITASVSAGNAIIQVTGETSHTIDWVSKAETF